MKGFGENFNKKNHNGNTKKYPSKEKIIQKALLLHSQGNIAEAKKYYQYCIEKKINDHRIFSNYSLILRNLGRFKEAELLMRKTIQIDPENSIPYINLGNLLRDLGKFKEAELLMRKTIQIDPKNPIAQINLGNLLKDLGQMKEAELSFLKAIQIDPKNPITFINLGNLLKDLGRMKEAELSLQKAIQIDPENKLGNLTLSNIYKDQGRLKEAEILLKKIIKINPEYTKAYYSLSTLNYSIKDNNWRANLFLKEFLNNKTTKEKIDIYFARAEVLHKEKSFKDCATNLQLGNNLKLAINPFNYESFIKKTDLLLSASENKEININNELEYPESIFIVGMPRSGSTLLESILSINENIDDLGEVNILEDAFLENQKSDQKISLNIKYHEKIKFIFNRSRGTTNKWLYNYQYAGIIANQLTNSKIIHCFRNPLDNILSMYRANFNQGNQYSCSIVDCAKVLLNQEDKMRIYKDQFRSKIYDLNYDLLVRDPEKTIKSLIKWLGWEWNESYLSPHLNNRAVLTRSNVEIRTPINSKSLGGWKNYRNMLHPAIEIICKVDRYKDIIF